MEYFKEIKKPIYQSLLILLAWICMPESLFEIFGPLNNDVDFRVHSLEREVPLDHAVHFTSRYAFLKDWMRINDAIIPTLTLSLVA